MDDVLSAAGALIAMMSWRAELLERAVRSADPARAGLAEAAAAARSLRVTAALATRLLEEGYATRVAEEEAEQAARVAAGSRNGLRVVRAGALRA